MSKVLEEFYLAWSNKSQEKIEYDNESAVRKIDTILRGMPGVGNLKFETMIDFGCGYGKALQICAKRLNLKKAYGFDFSGIAVDYAADYFGTDRLTYHCLKSLDIDENCRFIKSVTGGKVDCMLLIDVLEHVPDCKKFMLMLAELANYFIVKLPIEENVLNNYFLKKEYPSTRQANGHLREFNSNSVYYFIRTIGLTPLAEEIHIYDFRDSYPPPLTKLTLPQLLRRNVLKWFRMVVCRLLPRKLYIRLIGPGSYYCIATFSSEHILDP